MWTEQSSGSRDLPVVASPFRLGVAAFEEEMRKCLPDLGRRTLLRGSVGPGGGHFLRAGYRAASQGPGQCRWFGGGRSCRARSPADHADATGLTAAYSAALRPLRPRETGHDPGRIATACRSPAREPSRSSGPTVSILMGSKGWMSQGSCTRRPGTRWDAPRSSPGRAFARGVA